MCSGECSQGRSKCTRSCASKKATAWVFVEIAAGIVVILALALVVNLWFSFQQV